MVLELAQLVLHHVHAEIFRSSEFDGVLPLPVVPRLFFLWIVFDPRGVWHHVLRADGVLGQFLRHLIQRLLDALYRRVLDPLVDHGVLLDLGEGRESIHCLADEIRSVPGLVLNTCVLESIHEIVQQTIQSTRHGRLETIQ